MSDRLCLNHTVSNDSAEGGSMASEVGARVEHARAAAGLSQRTLADLTGISQPTLSRIISGDRTAKMPELAAIAWATGAVVTELAGSGSVAERAQCAARATADADMEVMRKALLHFLELDDYLSGQAIPEAILRRRAGNSVSRVRGQRAGH